MKKIGYLMVTLSLLCFSAQLYCLPVLRFMEAETIGRCYTNALTYLEEPPAVLAVLVLAVVFGVGVRLIWLERLPKAAEPVLPDEAPGPDGSDRPDAGEERTRPRRAMRAGA